MSTGKDDYVDKAFTAAEKKFGQMSGHNINTNSPKVKQTNEKITDKARQTFEKWTGKKVPSKVSN